MATIYSDQISIVDITDAYSVSLTSESHTFPGTTNAAKAGSVTTQISALCGSSSVAASVVLSEITKPAGVSVTSDGDSISPTLTISVTTSVTSGGVIKIPVHVGDDIVINKDFSFAIAFTGSAGTNGTSVTVSSTSVTYLGGTSGTTAPTGNWEPTIPSVAAGEYLWTKTVVTYSDGKSTTAYSVSRIGADGTDGTNGTSVTVKSTAVTYQKSTSGVTTPTGNWENTIPALSAGEYLWTKTVVTYSDNKSTTSYSVSRNGTNGTDGKDGTNGKDGADAITLSITSSAGTIFKNSAISTVLTAHVYKAGAELTTTQIAALGTIKWYKDGSTTAAATGQTFTISAGDVSNKATYIAQLEG